MMFFRIAMLILVTGGTSLLIAGFGWLINFMWVVSEPILASFFAIGCMAVAVACAFVILANLRGNERSELQDVMAPSRPPAKLVIMLVAIPMLTALISGGAIGSQILGDWNLPRRGSMSMEVIPESGPWVSFQINNQLMMLDMDSGEVVNWDPQQTDDIQTVTQDEFCVYNRKLVGRNGHWIPIEFDSESIYASDIGVITPGTHLVWKVFNALPKEQNGLWIRPLKTEAKPTRYSKYGWDPVWSRDGQTVYLCDGIGLCKIVDSKLEYLYKSEEEHTVCETNLSSDGQWLVFRVKSQGRGVKAQNRIVAVGPDGTSYELYSSELGVIADHPIWSNDGQRVAFRVKGTVRSVRTLMRVGRTGDNLQQLMHLKPGATLQAAGVQDFCWSPDDQQIVFVASLRGATLIKNEGGGLQHKFDLYSVNADGTSFRRLTKLRQKPNAYNSFPVIWWNEKAN